MTPEQLIAELTKKLDTAIGKIASMESELAPLRAQARREPQGPKPEEIIQAMIFDPKGTLARFKVPDEYQKHMTSALVTAEMQALGIPVDPAMHAKVAAFPQTQTVNELKQEVSQLRQLHTEAANKARADVNRESLKTASTDKNKYPHLAAAMAKNPELYASRVTAESDVATLADSIEKELAATAAALGFELKKSDAQSASQENAGDATTTTSTQVTAHMAGTRAGNPPPLPKANTSNGFTEADDSALKDKIARKYAAGAYGKPTEQPQ